MTSYAKSISGDDIGVLYQIIHSKYKKFRDFYRFVENLSDIIVSLDYEFSSKDSLGIWITFDKSADVDGIVSTLERQINDSDYTGDITSTNRKVLILLKTA